MRHVDDENRVPAVCTNCGSVYVAAIRQDGEIVPIGSRSACSTCGESAFEPIRDLNVDVGPDAEDADGDD